MYNPCQANILNKEIHFKKSKVKRNSNFAIECNCGGEKTYNME